MSASKAVQRSFALTLLLAGLMPLHARAAGNAVHQATGLREYNSGPTTDAHAGGWPKDKKEPEHTYLNVVGGFLEGAVDRRDGRPALTFRHHRVDGKVLNEDVLWAK